MNVWIDEPFRARLKSQAFAFGWGLLFGSALGSLTMRHYDMKPKGSFCVADNGTLSRCLDVVSKDGRCDCPRLGGEDLKGAYDEASACGMALKGIAISKGVYHAD